MRSGQKHIAVIDTGTTVRGRIEGEEDLHIEGRVEGEIRLVGGLFVGVDAVVEATVQAHRVEISGIVVGDVTAQEAVILTSTARVVGTVKGGVLSMAEGASIRGQVHSAASDGFNRSSGTARVRVPRERAATRSKSVARPSLRPTTKTKSSVAAKGANDDERTLVVTHSELRAGQKSTGDRAVKKAPKKAAKKTAAKKRTRAKVPARGKRKASRRS